MCEIKKSPTVDIKFDDLSYATNTGGNRSILKSISGKFCSGELTAILGASGSGKTTLLNILAGYISKGVTGSIQINEAPRDMRIFHKISAYIMQEDILQPRLSVEESMMTAAKLKMASHISLEQKRKTVMEVLNLLGLGSCLETWTERLSGGQRKRLSVALEMVSNPPVIFLDEPTSGLDTVSVKQCMEVLKSLTGYGRTVVCTIHQPSDSIFEMCNQVYFIQDGMCVYNGSTSNLVPFMSSVGYECPITYNPADYIIEIVQIIQESTPVLVDGIKNGKINMRESQTANCRDNCNLNRMICKTPKRKEETELDINFPTSSWSQFCVLLSRMIVQLRRDKLFIAMQLFSVAVGSSLIAVLYYKIGNNASFGFYNFMYCLCALIHFIYIYLMPVVLLFPPEVELLKREYFNRWYGLKPYFLALSLKSIPQMLICGAAFIVPTYLLTDQPLTADRFFYFTLASLLTAATSEGLGLAIASVCSVMGGAVISSILSGLLILFSMYGVGQTAYINFGFRIMMYTSFLRCSMVALVQSILGDRQPLNCSDEDYCLYEDPKLLLKEMGMLNASYGLHLLGLIIYLISFRILAFILLRYRLTSQVSGRYMPYVGKLFV